jgi:hypothetical protein
MRFHLPGLVAMLCVVTYGACGSSDEKLANRAASGESGEAGNAAGGGAGEHSEGGQAPGEAGAPGQGGATPVEDGGAAGMAASGGFEATGGAAGASALGGSGGEGGSAEPAERVVFVSSVAYTGNLGGLNGADAKCGALAAAAHLPGKFRAWLSDSTGSPSTRFTHPTADYVLADHTTIFAHGWSALTTAGNLHALNLTELGGAPPASTTTCGALNNGAATWVSTSADGTPAPGVAAGDHTCSDWSSEAVVTSGVGFGSPIDGNSWIGFCSTADAVCSKVATLFCFEQ